MRKILLIILTLFLGISEKINASNNFNQLTKKINETQGIVNLIDLCEDMENELNVLLNCKMLGVGDLKIAMSNAIENEKNRIQSEIEEKVKQEKLDKIVFFTKELNKSTIYMDFLNICEAVKSTYPSCKMPNDCEDSSISIIKENVDSCLKKEVPLLHECSDYIEVFIHDDEYAKEYTNPNNKCYIEDKQVACDFSKYYQDKNGNPVYKVKLTDKFYELVKNQPMCFKFLGWHGFFQ